MARKGRPVTGILLLDKPAGVTSNRALQRAKALYGARKAGHTGSLDPLATGLLPLCFGDATKVSAFLLDADKRYRVTARFGVVTDTGDAEGETVAESPVGTLERDRVIAAAQGLTGTMEQVPPMYSAVKHQGRRLYELAREGREVARDAREVTVHAFELIALREGEADFHVHCSKGTYVRTLIEDLGARLGPGAHVAALERTALGPFPEDIARVGLDELERVAHSSGNEGLDALLLPMDTALADWPAVRLTDEVAHFLRQGQAVWVPRAPEPGWVRLYDGNGRFLGMGEVIADGRIAPRRLVAAAAAA